MSVDKIEIDQDTRGCRCRVRRSRTFKTPRIFPDWAQAVVHAIAELQITDEVRDLLNAQIEATSKKATPSEPVNPAPDSDPVGTTEVSDRPDAG